MFFKKDMLKSYKNLKEHLQFVVHQNIWLQKCSQIVDINHL